jgi:hypothetical protein
VRLDPVGAIKSDSPMRLTVTKVRPLISTGVPPFRNPGATSTIVTAKPAESNQNAVDNPAKLAPEISAVR